MYICQIHVCPVALLLVAVGAPNCKLIIWVADSDRATHDVVVHHSVAVLATVGARAGSLAHHARVFDFLGIHYCSRIKGLRL